VLGELREITWGRSRCERQRKRTSGCIVGQGKKAWKKSERTGVEWKCCSLSHDSKEGKQALGGESSEERNRERKGGRENSDWKVVVGGTAWSSSGADGRRKKTCYGTNGERALSRSFKQEKKTGDYCEEKKEGKNTHFTG